jgi:GTP-binding protein
MSRVRLPSPALLYFGPDQIPELLGKASLTIGGRNACIAAGSRGEPEIGAKLMSLPVVVIMGRPNVGKSTLFNRIARSREAITDDLPGVTRDRHYRRVEWNGKQFYLIDTGGFLPRSSDEIDQHVRRQAEIAMEEADLILFLVDTHVGAADIDLEIARQLQRSAKATLLVANKADNPAYELESSTFYSLGLGDPLPVSATNGRNVAELLDEVTALFPKHDEDEAEFAGVRIAVIGRPNVGKSSLVNKLLGDERSIVSSVPGTTRDSVDAVLQFNEQDYMLIDTAGLRRKARVTDDLEFYTTLRTIRALQRADIALILVEAPEGITGQDIKIIEQAEESRKGIIIVVNKWDLVPKDTYTVDQFVRTFQQKAPMMKYIPLVFVSAMTGQRVTKVLEMASEINEERGKRIPTAELNAFLQEAVGKRHPAAKRGKFIKFYYVAQADVTPPTFVFFVNYPKSLDKSYLRYLENKLRDRFGFVGVAIRLKFKQRS